MSRKRLNSREQIRQPSLIPSHDPPPGPGLTQNKKWGAAGLRKILLLPACTHRCKSGAAAVEGGDWLAPESSMESLCCFLGFLLLAAGSPLTTATRE